MYRFDDVDDKRIAKGAIWETAKKHPEEQW